MLFDCGEGAQRQLMATVGLMPIEDVFLTHYHADHYLGLPGMLKSFDLQGRDTPITIYGPAGLKDLFQALRRIFGRLSYPLELVELQPGNVIDRDGYKIATFPTEHTIASYGYVLYEDMRPGHLDADKASSLGVEFGPDMGKLQRGESVKVGEREVRADELVGPPRAGRKIVISGDTAACDATRVAAHQSTLLVHDATFCADEAERARETGHTTAAEAAQVAADCEVEMLALTHLSTRYFGREIMSEATPIFKRTVVPRDFDLVDIPFPERGAPKLLKFDQWRKREVDNQ